MAVRFVAALSLACGSTALAAAPVVGADVSALPDLERAGAVYRDDAGRPADALAVLKSHGCDVFRVRLFVDPNPDPKANWGATQNLASVRTLARRIRAVGGRLLLDIHYSDTWADPAHQTKPAAWAKLDFDALTRRVGDYTESVLAALKADDTTPDFVQIGNEITAGLLWPDGRVSTGPDADPAAWRRLHALLASGIRAVRKTQTAGHPIRIILHVHGGGRPGLPQAFFDRLNAAGDRLDYDVIGLSFYPTWKDSIADLKANAEALIRTERKDILLAEVAYPWSPVAGIEGRESMQWPQSPAGQRQYLIDTRATLAALPGGHGLGLVWWYPESVRAPRLPVWRDGHEALFDADGRPLPALSAFAAGGK